MRIPASSVACLLAGGVLSIATPSAGRAQIAPRGSISVAGELGPRSYASTFDPLAIGKFEEYRDLGAKNRTSILVEQLFMKYAPADSFGFYSLSGRKLFDRDQSVGLLAKRPGLYDFQLRSDRIPHTYSTTARSPGNELGNPGFNTLPAIRPDSNAWRNGAYIGPIRNQVDPIKASLALTPNSNLDFKADYTHIAKKGGIPRSISFSGSSGPQREFVSPIDQTIHDARVSQGYTSGDRSASDVLPFIKSFQMNVAYAYSRFANGIKSTMVDNPQIGISSFTNGTATARVSLEPSNSAQTAAANGAVLLPMRTRLMGSASSTWARQNDPFFPQTSNDSLARDPNYGLVSSYTRPSLDGRIRTSTYTLSATSHPIDKLTVAARHRNFDQSNQTAPFGIRAMVVSDRTVTLADSERFEPHPFTKANTNVTASYLVARGLAISAGYAWEDWTRDPDVRNIEKTAEKTPRASIDYTALDRFTFRASYTSGSRRGNTPYTEAATEILNFRRFDEADRDRTRITFAGSVMPTEEITVGWTLETGNDKFPNSQYGVQSDKSLTRGLDVDWSPAARFSASVGWMLEDVKDSANYRYRTGAVGSVTYDNPSYRWMNTNKDKNTTWFANVNATLVPEKLDLIGTWSYIDSHWWMFNVNPTTPTGGTAAQNLSATAQDWPEVKQRLEPLSLGLRYRHSEEWAMTLRFQAEKYSQTDFRTVAPVFTTTGLNGAPLLPVGYSPGELPGTIGQVAGSNTGQYHFLGNNYRPYTANSITLMVSYHPALIPFEKGRSTF
jgi:MtrB/PioB family decaheme-associated outer membrane protein